MAMRDLKLKARGKKSRKIKPVYLVIAEGKNKTETLYFSNFQTQGHDYCLKIVKAGNRTDAESLYKTIHAKWNELELSEENGDKGYIVLDIDNNSQKAEKVRSLMKKKKAGSIEFIVSNPVFELWLLMHFRYTTKFFRDGSEVISELKKYIPDYEKNRNYYALCADKVDVALLNTDNLKTSFGGKEWPSIECNPRTDVSELVKCLL